jgi:hypothetical protein
MPAPNASQQIETQPLGMVGGNKFGRYSKISVEETFNFIISDNALVPYAGYKVVVEQSPTVKGRGIYASSRGNIMIVVLGSNVYAINYLLQATFVGALETSNGDVFIAENNSGQIAITDLVHIYVYNWLTNTAPLLYKSGTDFTIPASLKNPGYISFQNQRLITVDTSSNAWYLSDFNAATVWPTNASSIGSLQSKPDKIQAAVPTPGGGNNLVLFGHNVVEQWQDVGTALFPYQRSSTFNVDFGTLNASTIAALDNYVVWLAANEQGGATVMIYSGNSAQSISTDGIDFRLANLTNPENCTGFLFRQDGHVIYQFTFPDDNLSYILDLKTQTFFTVTDENLDYHIARNVVFFNNKYYFVSLKGGNVYEMSTTYTDYVYSDTDIKPIPRIRKLAPMRLASQRMVIIKSTGFTIENGQTNEVVDGQPTESVDLSISRNGGESFGSAWRQYMNPTGQYRSRFIYQRLGQANDTSIQYRFNGFSRFVVFEGEAEVYS